MASREEFLKQLWRHNINSCMQEHWIDNAIRHSERRPDSPFADLGPALKRLLAVGAARRDLSLVARASAYESVFGTLYALSDPGVEERRRNAPRIPSISRPEWKRWPSRLGTHEDRVAVHDSAKASWLSIPGDLV
jgi:hypothetical protein